MAGRNIRLSSVRACRVSTYLHQARSQAASTHTDAGSMGGGTVHLLCPLTMDQDHGPCPADHTSHQHRAYHCQWPHIVVAPSRHHQASRANSTAGPSSDSTCTINDTRLRSTNKKQVHPPDMQQYVSESESRYLQQNSAQELIPASVIMRLCHCRPWNWDAKLTPMPVRRRRLRGYQIRHGSEHLVYCRYGFRPTEEYNINHQRKLQEIGDGNRTMLGAGSWSNSWNPLIIAGIGNWSPVLGSHLTQYH